MKKAGMCIVVSAAVTAQLEQFNKEVVGNDALSLNDIESPLVGVQTDVNGVTTISVNEDALLAYIKFTVKIHKVLKPFLKAVEAMSFAIMEIIAIDSKAFKKELEEIEAKTK